MSTTLNLACSALCLRGEDGVRLGRTVDFVPCGPEVITRGAGKYAYIGTVLHAGELDTGTPLWLDGVNAPGLMMALLGFPGGVFFEKEGATPIHPGQIVATVLADCATVDEVIALLDGIVPSPAEPKTAVHYILADDATTAIVEPSECGWAVYRDVPGVMTNAPAYPTHLAAVEKGEPILPGDFSSTARFCRLTAIRNALDTTQPSDALLLASLAAMVVPCGCDERANYQTEAIHLMSRGHYSFWDKDGVRRETL